MAAPRRSWAAELIHFWFNKLRPRDWYQPDPRADSVLRARFGRELAMLWTRPAREFAGDPQIALASVLLFDQLPRNLYRGKSRAFAFDPLARSIARRALKRGYASRLPREQRQFLAMPLMHSENIADQAWSLAFFNGLGLPLNRRYARDHHRMIARFGRFPHRNKVLGRKSTPAEKRAVAAGFAW